MPSDDLKRTVEIDPSIGAIEIKITARAKDEDVVRGALEAQDVEAEEREIYFFDTPELGLFEAGLVLRARLVHDGADDSTVKLRPVVPEELSEYWKELDGFEVELDAVGEDAICSAKLSVDQNRGEIQEVAEGRREVRKLFSKEQEKLLEEHGPGNITWDDLTVLGPVEVRKWEVQPKGFDYEVTVEEWVLPDDSDLVELSVKAEPGDAGKASGAFVEVLSVARHRHRRRPADEDPRGAPLLHDRGGDLLEAAAAYNVCGHRYRLGSGSASPSARNVRSPSMPPS
jgi:hypothetical protein